MATDEAGPLRYSPVSLTCRRSAPSVLLATSQAAGWTSVLLEHNRVVPDETPFEIAATPDQTLVVQTRGEQELETFRDGRWCGARYRAGTAGMTQAGTAARLRRRVRAGGQAFEKINLYIPTALFDEAEDHFRRAGRTSRPGPLTALAFEDEWVAQTVRAMGRAAVAGAPDLYAQAAAQVLATHLLSAHSPWPQLDDRRRPGDLADRRLARVLAYMEAHCSEPLKLDRLAAEAGVSKFHFARLFKARTGSTPHARLVGLRLEKSQALLLSTDLAIAEVARRCGFNSPDHFGVVFLKRFGTAPTFYRVTRSHAF